jgi:hypothetical protein
LNGAVPSAGTRQWVINAAVPLGISITFTKWIVSTVLVSLPRLDGCAQQAIEHPTTRIK